jgi:hypothetical protein
MAHLTEKDLTKLAGAVADDFVKQGVALNETITKLATDMGMTDEQVARLCEATNNVTFNKLFQAKGQDKTASDRLIDFEVADTKKVLGNLVKQAEGPDTRVKEAAYWEMRSLDDGMHSLRNPEPNYDATEKVAFVLRPETLPSKERDDRALRKTADHLRHEKLAAEMAYHDKLVDLGKHFSKLYKGMPFTEFEKSAAVVHGKVAEMHLNSIRALRNLPEVTYDIAKLTKTAGHVDDSGEEMRLFAELLSSADEIRKLSAAINKIGAV